MVQLQEDQADEPEELRATNSAPWQLDCKPRRIEWSKCSKHKTVRNLKPQTTPATDSEKSLQSRPRLDVYEGRYVFG